MKLTAAVIVAAGIGGALWCTNSGQEPAPDIKSLMALRIRPLPAAPSDPMPDGVKLSDLPAVKWFQLTGALPPGGQKPLDIEVIGENGQRADVGVIEQSPDRRYLAVINSYDIAPTKPKLRIVWGGETLLESSIEPLPSTARVLDPVTKKDPRFTASYVEHKTMRKREQAPRAVKLTLARPPAKDEMAEVFVYRTTFFDGTRLGPHMFRNYILSGSNSVELNLPNAEDTREMEIGVRYMKLTHAKDRISLSGPELVEKDGNAHVVNVAERRVTTKSGFQVVFYKQRAIDRPGTRGNRTVTMALSAVNPADPAIYRDYNALGSPAATMTIVSPKPDDLGLEKITAGPVVLRGAQPATAPLKTGPITLTLDVEGTLTKPQELVRAKIPVAR